MDLPALLAHWSRPWPSQCKVTPWLFSFCDGEIYHLPRVFHQPMVYREKDLGLERLEVR
jgi:hypothetical protein